MKKNQIISVILSLALVFTLAVVASADNPASLKLGDTNGDGVINANDALEVLQYSVGKIDQFTAEKPVESTTPEPPDNTDTIHKERSMEALIAWMNSDAALTDNQGFNRNYVNMVRAQKTLLIPQLSITENYACFELDYYLLYDTEENERITICFRPKPENAASFDSIWDSLPEDYVDGQDYSFDDDQYYTLYKDTCTIGTGEQLQCEKLIRKSHASGYRSTEIEFYYGGYTVSFMYSTDLDLHYLNELTFTTVDLTAPPVPDSSEPVDSSEPIVPSEPQQ